MAGDRHQDYRRIESGNTARYVLPRRSIAQIKWFGLMIVTTFMIMTAVGVFAAVYTGFDLGLQHGASKAFEFFRIVFSALFAAISLFFATIGFGILMSRGELRTPDGAWNRVERLGLFKFTFSEIRLEKIVRLEISPAKSFIDSNSGYRGCKLVAESQGGQGQLVAWGYPRHMLRALAGELVEQCNTVNSGQARDGEAIGKIVVEELSRDDVELAAREMFPRPDEAISSFETDRHGLTLTVPPAGITKGNKRPLVFALLWNPLFAAIVAVLIWQRLWIGVLICVPHVVIGIVSALAVINRGGRSAIIDVFDDTLLVNCRGIFGTRQYQWSRDELERIHIGGTGVRAFKSTTMCLMVTPRESPKVKLLSQLAYDELKWIAGELNEALHMHEAGDGTGAGVNKFQE